MCKAGPTSSVCLPLPLQGVGLLKMSLQATSASLSPHPPSPLPTHLPLPQGAGLFKEGAQPPKMSPQDVVEFIFFPVVNEGCRVLDEGARPSAVLPVCVACRRALWWLTFFQVVSGVCCVLDEGAFASEGS